MLIEKHCRRQIYCRRLQSCQLATLLGGLSEELSWADIGRLALLPGSSGQALYWDDLRELSTVWAPIYCGAKGVIESFRRRRYWVRPLTFYEQSTFERGDESWSVFADLCIGATDGEADKTE